MKKIIFLSIISLSLCLPLFSCKKQSFRKGIKVGVISNYLDTSEVSEIKDAYDSVISWLKKNRIEYIFRKPNGNTSENRETSIRILNSSGCNYFITLGSEFGESIDFIKKRFPDNKTIAFDVSYDDVFYSVYEDYNPSKREEKIKEYKLGECIHLVDFKKEELGFIGGYSLIKEGNSNVGFLANKNTPENNHYGYGFIKGVEEASKELNKEVNIKYAYMNSNEKNNETIGRLDTWFGQGMESLFVTGRNAYKNAVHSASKNGVFGKVIIGDTNRSEELDSGYKDNILEI